MALLFAVETLLGCLRYLTLGLRAVLLHMAVLSAIVTKLFAAVNGVTSIIETSKDLILRLRPAIPFLGASRLSREAVRDSVLLLGISLKIHIGESTQKWAFNTNEPKINTTFNESKLDILERRSAAERLDVLLESLFGLVHIFDSGCRLHLLPGSFSRYIIDVITVDLARLVAVTLEVPFRVTLAAMLPSDKEATHHLHHSCCRS